MTEQQAREIVMLIRAAAAHPIDQTTLDYFETRMLGLEYEPALTAATLGAATTWTRFPSWATFMEMYRMQHRQETERARPAPPTFERGKIPFWVKRWIAARYLYARFGRDQDMRPFPEEKSQVDPFDQEGIEWMPEHEWVDEGKRVDDRTAWAVLNREEVRT